MGVNTFNSVSSDIAATYTNYSNDKVNSNKDDTKPNSDTSKSTGFSDVAATYEKSPEVSKDGTYKKVNDRSALIERMKADQAQLKKNLFDMVKSTMSGQAGAFAISQNDADMWKMIASGNFTASAEDIAKAKEDISDDGYWGVDKTSSRIVDFAIALSGNDTSKADKLLDAFKKGYSQATGAWGKDLPDISSKTYDAVVKKFDEWKNGTYTPSEPELLNNEEEK